MMPSNFLTLAPAARNMPAGKADLVAVAEPMGVEVTEPMGVDVAEPMGPKHHFRYWRVANERSRVQADTHAGAE
jgi:hypothetical protein